MHLLYAYSHQLGIVLGQKECSRKKTNEIPISKKLIGGAENKRRHYNMLCQKEMVKKSGKDNDILLPLKQIIRLWSKL